MSKAEVVAALQALPPTEQADVLCEAFGLSQMELAAILLREDYLYNTELLAFTLGLEGEAPLFPDEPADFLTPYQGA